MPAITPISALEFHSPAYALSPTSHSCTEPRSPDDPPPIAPPAEPDEFDPDDVEIPCTDDAHWDVFIADDDQYDPLPDPGDFWIEDPEDLRADVQVPEFCLHP